MQMQQSPSVWGSRLWVVLHAIGTRTGRSPYKLRGDELRTLRWMVNNLETIIPCQECCTHIEAYRKEFPPPEDSPADYNYWFWQFHESVNHRLGKVGMAFSEISQNQKGDIRVIDSWKEFVAVVKLPSAQLKIFERHIRLWGGFAGI